uniref:tRNA (uracil(54)-C(5))-methyltransferase n=1 Tax=Aceria tosichella TaxID=561515 RepID=A0A6G1SMT8_9ACAR
MIFKYFIQRNNSIRLYHEVASQKQKLPTIRVANTRVRRANELKRHHESTPRVSSYGNPNVRYEPFPFKVTEANKIECLKRKITPLYEIPYEEQLTSKEAFCRNALRLLGQELYKSGTPVRLDLKRLPCHVNSIVPSPQLTNYRNKDEFSIWRGFDGKTITAGHMIFPLSKHGDTVSVEPDGCDVMKDETIKLVNIFNQFLREKAKLPVSYDLGAEGGWRRIIIRVNLDGDLMLIGVINPRTLRVREVLDERDNFKEFMVKRCQEAGLRLTSLYYQPCPHNNCKHKDVPFELLHGDKTILESIGDFRIQISPESFLHNSSMGAEVLYDTTRSMIEECFLRADEGRSSSRRPIILDANCGAGLLSFNLASLAELVVGIDNSPQSIDDAITNAKLNNITNIEFVNSSLEIVLGRILEKYNRQRSEMIVVCDTPNSGLHPNVIDVLRHSRDLNKILIITPKIDSSNVMDNLVRLCSKHRGKSIPPFAPILATPVDTCPHIESFQTIIALERLPE